MSFDATTSNFGFRLINFATDPYTDDEWFNWKLLDGLLTGSQSGIPFCIATGTGSAFVADYTPDQTLAIGLSLAIKTPLANTGAVTLAVDGAAAKPIKINGSDPAAGAFPAGMYLRLVYDGTNFNVVYPTFTLSQGSKITTAASGATASNGAADFQVESNTNIGMSLLCPNGSFIGRYFLGNVSKPDAGGLYYDFSVDRLYLRAGQQNGPYVDSNKLVRQPNLPIFYAYRNVVSGSYPSNSVGTVFIANTEVLDQTNSYDNSTGIFVAPVAGVYEFEFEFDEFQNSGDSINWNIGVLVNNVQSGPTFRTVSPYIYYSNHKIMHFKYIVSLAANDQVKIAIVSSSSGLLGGSGNYMFTFTGKMIP